VREIHGNNVAAMVAAAQPYAAHGCIYMYDGPPIIYLLTHSCLPTRYVFPGHLVDAEEADATDAARSMTKLLASRPSAIFVPDLHVGKPRNPQTVALLERALATDYQRVAVLPGVIPHRLQILYARKDLVQQGHAGD
jgi:hypothetical protein